MKLSKIYANKNFQNISFNETGLNVVIGEIVDKSNKEKDTHNLGKTSLINVIDFMLLKRQDKEGFFERNLNVFKEHIFYIEILLNNGKYLVIKRSVALPTKISFKLNNKKLTSFLTAIDWDEIDLSFDKARKKLESFLGFDILTSHGYRSTLSYFLRNQYDYRDVFQLSKFIGKHKDWKPIIFDLLGFDGEIIFHKYELEDEKENLIRAAEEIKKQDIIDVTEADKLKGILEIKNEELKEAESKIDDFNFYTHDKEISEELLGKIDAQISSYNSIRYNLMFDIDRTEKSLNNELPMFDVDSLAKLFKDVKLYFHKNLVKEYRDLEEFNEKVSRERQKYLKNNLTEYKKELRDVEGNLSDLEKQKSKLLSVLKDKDSYEKFKFYQKQLSKIESEIVRLEERLKSIDKVFDLEVIIKKKNDAIEESSKLISESVKTGNDFYKEIRKSFNWIVKNILSSPAIISITTNTEGNVEFNANMQNRENLELTAQAYGTTYKKLLCIAFDLALLIAYSDRSFYKFVYHDGCLEGLDDRKKINFINLIRDICSKYNLQYILTLIDSDLPYDEFDKLIKFPSNELILHLNDKDEKGTLFQMKF